MNIHEIIEGCATKQMTLGSDVLSLYARTNVSNDEFFLKIYGPEEIILTDHIDSIFKKHKKDIKFYKSDNLKCTEYFISGEDCRILIQNYISADKCNNIHIYYFCGNESMLLVGELIDILKKIDREVCEAFGKENFNFLLNGRDGLYITSIMGKCKSRPLIQENYNENVCEQYKNIVDAWKEPDNKSGRLVILTGKPGSGKTYMIRSFQNELKNCELITVPSNCAQLLSDPSLLQVLNDFSRDGGEFNSGKSIVFVIEDADSLLQKRDGYNNDLVSSILNLTDGLFASAFDIKMILTTNSKITEFDDALIRNGRLFKHIEINELSRERAESFLRKNNYNGQFPESLILANLYSLIDNNKNNVSKNGNKKIGF